VKIAKDARDRALSLVGAAAVVAGALWFGPAPGVGLPAQTRPARPNVLLIITDDQGFGDLDIHGNPKIHTQNLDRLARESVQFRSFYVSPVCSPTRASLMTGRYNYRTGVVDTYLGRSLMHADEVTLAEMLADAGYRTGIFGKWHLGDNYPLRAMDQGFQESLVLNGGGIGQPSDPVGGESYFDPLLRRNGVWVKTKGYVSDVITDAALKFINENRDRPFFAYLAFNAPHTPLEVPERYYAKYKQMNLRREDFPGVKEVGGNPIPQSFDPETTAKIYGMVENIDDNLGRLLRRLDELELSDNTVVIFMTDNGPQQPRYNAGMFQRKGTTHEGGIRVPFFVRWPGRFEAGRKLGRIAAHIDVTPTLLEVCGVAKPTQVKFDGVSLLPLLKGERVDWPDRILFFQWHRGDAPELYRAFAARSEQYKLVQPVGQTGQTGQAGQAGQNDGGWSPAFKLYDMRRDPLETRDLAAAQPEVVEKLKRAYEVWFKDVTSGRRYADPQISVARIFIGSPQENPVRLTRQDWRGPQAGWTPHSLGHWEVNVSRAGAYAIAARVNKSDKPATATFALGGVALRQNVPAGAIEVVFSEARLPQGTGRLECYVEQDGKKFGVRDVTVRRLR
jgi:arylsulfatase A-like enzyme